MKMPNSPFATCLSGSAKETELRIRNIFQWKKKRPPVVAMILAALAALFCGGLVSCQPSGAELPDESVVLDAEFSLRDDIVYIKYAQSDTWEAWSDPVPAPASWATQDLAGRDEAETLKYHEDAAWITLTSENHGWLVVSAAGVAHADTYVYRTQDGGRTWEEVGQPEDAHWYPACVDFLDDDHAIIGFGVFVDAPIYRTENGGETWIKITNLPLPDGSWEAASITHEGSVVTMCVRSCDEAQAGLEITLDSEDYGEHWSINGEKSLLTKLDMSNGAQAFVRPKDDKTAELVYSADGQEWVLDVDSLLHQYAIEPVSDFMGFDGFSCRVDYSRAWGYCNYYAIREDGPYLIAYCYGYTGEWLVDLDGDGTEEYICNCVTNADGHANVYVYRRNGNDVELGTLRWSADELSGYRNWGLNSSWEEYDPEQKAFLLHYDNGGGGFAVKKYGLESIVFEPLEDCIGKYL